MPVTTLVLLLTTLMGDAPPAPAERLLAAEIESIGSGRKVLRTMEYDFSAGRRREVSVLAKVPPAQGIQAALGKNGQVFVLHGSLMKPDDRRTVSGARGAVARAVESLEGQIDLITLSPDGERLAAVDPERERLLFVDKDGVREIPVSGKISHPLSWNRDSTAVAFYFATSSTGDDSKFQEHGVGVVTLNGTVRAISNATQETGTPYTGAKDVPIGWGPAGDVLYFTQGALDTDPPADPQQRRMHMRPCVTIRVDLKSGTQEMLSVGEFCDVAPDGSYVLTNGLDRTANGKLERGCWQVDVATRERRRLPEGFSYPKLSPSGKLAACLQKGGIVCLRTDSWERVGSLVPTSGGSMQVVEWSTRFGWIVPPAASQPASRPR